MTQVDIRSPVRLTCIISRESLCAEAALNWNRDIECTCVPLLGILLSEGIVSFTGKEACALCGVGGVGVCGWT